MNGDYIAEDNTRFTVSTARRVRSADGINVGYEQFASLADALAAWGLTACPIEEPLTETE